MTDSNNDVAAKSHYHTVIIGIGFSGLGMAIQMKKNGLNDFIILERDKGVGGTWLVNDYPGLACDVPSHLYSFSFEPNPNWARMFAPGPEIQKYLESCWHKYHLNEKTRLNTNVNHMSWDDQDNLWHVTDNEGNHYTAKFLVSGMGALSNAFIPNIKGVENFNGEIFHSQQWNHDYDLTNKHVAIIGTGASAIQFVPEVQKKVAKLDLYQRTPPWIMPKPDRDISDKERSRFNRFGFTQKLWRLFIYLSLEVRVIPMAFMPNLLKAAEFFAKRHLSKVVNDPVLREKLTPTYRLGCKRVLLSNDYLPSLTKPNVEVITTGVQEIREKAVVTTDGRVREVDAIIFGTGFKPADPVPEGAILGRQGVDLAIVWRNGVMAYKGTMVNDFPNLFFLLGPNTGLGHNSVIFMIEAQIQYVIKAMKFMERDHLDVLEPTPEAQANFNDKLQKKLEGSVWNSGGCVSWYLHPTSGRNYSLWPTFTLSFQSALQHFDPQSFLFDRIKNNPRTKLKAMEASEVT